MEELSTAVTTSFSGLQTSVVAIGIIIIGISATIGAIFLFKRMGKSVS